MPTGHQVEAVLPLKGRAPVQRDWGIVGLPESGWVLVFDQVVCDLCRESIGQSAPPCVASCASAHGLDPELRLNGEICSQCNPAPCAEVCPTEAVFRTSQGVVEVNQELCIGCQFCLDVCPHEALIYIDPYSTALPPFSLQGYSPDRPHGELPRTVAKCTLCTYRLLSSELPVCVDACPYNAQWIGNLDRNNAVGGAGVVRLTDLLKGRRFEVSQPGRRVVRLVR